MIFETENGVLIYYLPEELDHFAADMIKRKTEHVFEQDTIRYLIFDFSKTTFMDSSGIGIIVGRYKKISCFQGKVYAIHANMQIRKILHMSGLKRIVEIVEEM